nr:MAG TPA: hypothetical protein [Caudoviricetes sp.]
MIQKLFCFFITSLVEYPSNIHSISHLFSQS